ncbi:cytochrome P450 [Kribbella sp. NPDC050459]|uniref:cytochrome P450 n=1 Tax=Kribbella sp. NPDC050459 TaxID=3155785 RepID=UPI0033D8E2F2
MTLPRQEPPAYDALADPRTYVNGPPWALFARLRREAPVAWIEEPVVIRRSGGLERATRGPGFWAVTSHALVDMVSRQPDLFSSAERGPFLPEPQSRSDLERMRRMLVGMDAPEHRTYRQRVTQVLDSQAVRAMKESIDGHAQAVVRRAVEAGRFEAIGDVAADLPLLVLADLLGIPHSDRTLFMQWSNALVGFDDPAFGGGDVRVFRQAIADAFGYAAGIRADRLRTPCDDLVSKLVVSEADGRRLTELEFSHLWLLLIVAGNETTRHLISAGLELVATEPGLAAELAADEQLLPTFVDELLRWSTPIMQFRRTVTSDTVLGTQRLRAGDKVVLYYVSANRDETVFTQPERFDPRRSPNPHLAFGVGPHFCLGWHVARAEAIALFGAFRQWLPQVRLEADPVRLESNFMNGIRELRMMLAAN